MKLPGIDDKKIIPSWPLVIRENSSRRYTMKMHIVNKLEELKHSGAAWQKMAKGDHVMSELRDLLTDEEYVELSIARGHYLIGEGRGEVDGVCNRLIAKYRADVDPRTFTKTLL